MRGHGPGPVGHQRPGPYVRLADVVSVCPLTEIETWAVLCLSIQKLQDKLLKSSATSKEGAGMFVCSDTLLIHSTGAISVIEPHYAYASYAGPGVRHAVSTQSVNMKKGTESRGLAAIGQTLSKSAGPVMTSELRGLLSRLLDPDTDLVHVLQAVQNFWRRHKTVSVSQIVARIYKNTIAAYTKSSVLEDQGCLVGRVLSELNTHRYAQNSTLYTNNRVQKSTEHEYRQGVDQNMQYKEQQRRNTVDFQAFRPDDLERQKRYGKRLEFRPPPLSEKMPRKFGELDHNKSLSTSAIDEHLEDFVFRNEFPAKLSVGQQQRGVEPEFVIGARKTVAVASLAKQESNSYIFVRLISGENVKLKVDEGTRIGEVLASALELQGVERAEESSFCVCTLKEQEYFYLPPSQKVHKLTAESEEELPNENPPRKTKLRRRSGSVSRTKRDGQTVYLRFVELEENYENMNPGMVHLLYLQLRQDLLAGTYRLEEVDHYKLGLLGLKADLVQLQVNRLPGFKVHHYLPLPLIKYAGEKRAKEKLLKLARDFDATTTGGRLELAWIQRLASITSISSFIYIEANQSLELHLGTRGIALVQAGHATATGIATSTAATTSVSVTLHPIKTVEWQNLRELKHLGDQIQFLDAATNTKVKVGFGRRTRRVAELLEVICRKHAGQSEPTDRGRRFRDFYQRLRSHVTAVDPIAVGAAVVGGRSEVKKKRRSLPTLGPELRSSLVESKTRCSIRRLKHYGSMANSIIVKSATDLVYASKSSGVLSRTDSRSASSVFGTYSSEAPPSSSSSSDGRGQEKKLRLDEGTQAYRYRVYLENDDYDDVDSSMESTGVIQADGQLAPQVRKKTKTVRMGTRAIQDLGIVINDALKSGRNAGKSGISMGSADISAKMSRSCENLFGPRCREGRSLHQPEGGKNLRPRPTGGLQARTIVEPCPPPSSIAESLDSSLSMSLLERFENMDTAEWEPRRKLCRVTVRRSRVTGRLGVRITETPSGIYVEGLEESPPDSHVWEDRFPTADSDSGVSLPTADSDSGVSLGETKNCFGSLVRRGVCVETLRVGDKILEVDGVRIEGMGYSRVLQTFREAGDSVEFLVSQLVVDQ